MERQRLRLLLAALALIGACAGALASTGAGASASSETTDGADARGPLDLARLDVSQSGRRLTVRLATRGHWRLRDLDRRPEPSTGAPDSYLCLESLQGGTATRSCFGERPDGKRKLTTGRIHGDGHVHSWEAAVATIRRPTHRSIEAVLRFREIGLQPGRLAMRALSAWDGEGCAARSAQSDCIDALPDRGFVPERIKHPRLVGCTSEPGGVIRNGSRERKLVALTFDDGPSAYTDDFLDTLRRAGAKATFFVQGDLVSPYAPLLRRILKQGNEIGNHSWRHDPSPSQSQLAATNSRIRSATGGFQPCDFRPPGGTLSAPSISAARRLGMATIIWDVDPQDWRRPGSGAIYSRVVGAVQPGSIVLMHDGGGDRSQTLAALPSIINNLQHRGYRLVTVSHLLGGRRIWGPRGD